MSVKKTTAEDFEISKPEQMGFMGEHLVIIGQEGSHQTIIRVPMTAEMRQELIRVLQESMKPQAMSGQIIGDRPKDVKDVEG